MVTSGGAVGSAPKFQCSSASRKFLNISYCVSIIPRKRVSVLFSEPKIPQVPCVLRRPKSRTCFSALQRAENSSTSRLPWGVQGRLQFQCSSASRKFLNLQVTVTSLDADYVSVLFSEPKIPQLCPTRPGLRWCIGFSALQRAENSSTSHGSGWACEPWSFSALQRAENSSI